MTKAQIRSTTVLAVQRDGKTAMAADGQVTMDTSIVKRTARKLHLIHNDTILVGFAGSAADSFALFEHFEERVKEFSGDIERSAVELAKAWRMDKMLRRLEALLIVANSAHIFLVSGTGDVIEPEEGVLAIGSGGNYATAAARAFLQGSDFSASEIAQKSLEIAADICVYTNHSITVKEV